MLNTLRGHENPALEVAIQLSNALNLPILVYTMLNDKWEHATERRFTFMLEALRSVSNELRSKQNIPLAVCAQCKARTYKPWHLTLGSRNAAAIVIDEPYTEPYVTISNRLKRVLAPSIAVDNACILTPQAVRPGLDRAYKFLNATKSKRNSRLSWIVQENKLDEHLQIKSNELYQNLPFETVDLCSTARTHEESDNVTTIDSVIKNLLKNIDYDVPKIVGTKGDSESGYRRWQQFLKHGLKNYDKRRNNVLFHYSYGVSRMSCYLNLGIVSPFKIVRTILESKIKNEKFLSEFLCWRELSYCFCFYNPKYLVLKAVLPAWAYNTLSKHTVDQRSRLYSLEQLKAFKTVDVLWNLCQQSLVETGELHNNLRMAWGKQVLLWTDTMENAYKILIYLNDHYALDGGAPPSYCGIGWCLGLFDSPKSESKIFGKVRYKSTVSKAKHLNVEKYKEQILMHSVSQSKRKFIALFSNGNQKATVKDANILCQDSNSKNDGVAQKKIRRDIKGFLQRP
eukprot:g1158.t1